MKERIIKTIAELVVIAIVVYLIVVLCTSLGISEANAEDQYETMYVLCSDFVYARSTPNKKQEPIGRLDPGDEVVVDGRKKNGYVHCIDLSFEQSDGWIYGGYLVRDCPEKLGQTATIVSHGRLAARKYVNGRRTRWLKSGAQLKVWYWSTDWALTDCGYVQSKYLELDGE
jgi:hypothetical protein